MSEQSNAPANALLAAQHQRAVISLRGNAEQPAFASAVKSALGIALPAQPCTFNSDGPNRLIWAGPDSWYSVGPSGTQAPTESALRSALAEVHSAVVDVSDGYFVVSLSGPQARSVLAQGCPLDLHPRVFTTGMSASSHFFKAGILLWMICDEPVFEVMVRRTFASYFWRLIEASTAEYGLHRPDSQ